MADQPKKKNPSSVSRNDSRPNGKATKTRPDATFRHGEAYRGSHTRRSPQTAVQKVLLGGGAHRNINRRVDGTQPMAWKLPTKVVVPWNRANVEENRRLYPHLFTEKD